MPLDDYHTRSWIYEVRQLYYHMKNHMELLNRQIQLDGLTGIANRHRFNEVIKARIENRAPFSLILVDIDNFKKVNDTYGHLVGDEVLQYLSAMMGSHAREGDLVFRYGGEEFGILLSGVHAEEAKQIAERLRTEIAQTVSPTGKPITISLGITSLYETDSHPKTIIERADTALYQSKSAGRNRSTIYEETP